MSLQLFDWNEQDYAAVCIVPTPSIDASGIAHLVEHLVFRYSDKYPSGHELFVANTLLPVKINATTQDGYTLFYVVSPEQEVFLACLDFLVHGLDQLDYPEQTIELERDGVLQRELQWLESLPEYMSAALINRTNPSCIHAGGYSDLMPFNNIGNVEVYKRICYLRSHRQWLVNGKDLKQSDLACLGSPTALFSDSLTTSQYDVQKLPEVIQELLSQSVPAAYTEALLQSAKEQLMQTLAMRFLEPGQPEILPYQSKPMPCPKECVQKTMSLLAQACQCHISSENIPPLPNFIQSQVAEYPMLLLGQPCQNIVLKKLDELEIELVTQADFWQKRLQGQCYAMGIGRFEEDIYQYVFAENTKLSSSST
ncbi:insulinase family protein [Alteromonas sp. LMIT006]|uniref:insulinase family protein n=1 Tax=Alteromonadaceae TaxID=72275 RepID=UPI0020CA4D5E|nr:insulinase family protein [Alteromonas sp. LMIT006]UTP72482.1 insulinase family protein [Alteromonas sp. LMIT006]